MKTPQERAEEVIRKMPWWAGTLLPDARKILSDLIVEAINQALAERPAEVILKQADPLAVEMADRPFRKTKA